MASSSRPPQRAGAPARLANFLISAPACHGADGIACSADVPNLAGQHELYLYNRVKALADGKRPQWEIRFMSRMLTDADMREIARCYERMPH